MTSGGATDGIGRLRRVGDDIWELPRVGGMRVPGRVFADADLAATLAGDQSLTQVANVAHLPGIVRYSFAMPDVHFGYGFPIGGVAAFDVAEGVVSPGGVGYDINCGVRLLTTELTRADLGPQPERLVERVIDRLFSDVPAGVGSHGAIARLSQADLRVVVVAGAAWAVEKGYGRPTDLDHTEAGGALPGADPDSIGERAYARGSDQLGTLGSGNHFLELQVVDEVFDSEAATAFGLFAEQLTVMVHCGSRGFGYQVCEDSVAVMGQAARRYRLDLPDRQLACAPVGSDEGRRYLAAMAGAANYAWANRQMIMHLVSEALPRALSMEPATIGLRLLYDLAHNVAKLEEHEIDGTMRQLCVHRKGATRAFGPGHP